MTIYPDPEESNIWDSICLIIVWIIAFFVFFFTLPGCQSDDQKQQYRPFYDPPSKQKPSEKIRKPIHDAAVRVDDVLEKTPVPAVAEVLTDDLLDTYEKIETRVLIDPDPEIEDIINKNPIEPKPDPMFVLPEVDEESLIATEQPDAEYGLGTWIVVFIGIGGVIYICFKMIKGMKDDVENTERDSSTS